MSGVPTIVQTTAVITAAPRANQNSSAAARSARRCARVDDDCACSTRRRMPARAVSSPISVTSRVRGRSVATVPATTRSPSPRDTGVDSPVTMDSSTSAWPSMTRPSAGMRPPGRTTTRSPTLSSEGATVRVEPSSWSSSASSGSSAASSSRALEVRAREAISTQWPSSMMTTSMASSHQNSSCGSSRPRWLPHEARKATVMPRAIRVIMPGLRCLISSTAPVRNGRPVQT